MRSELFLQLYQIEFQFNQKLSNNIMIMFVFLPNYKSTHNY